MRCRVAGVGLNGELQRHACLLELALRAIEHRQIVVWLRQFRVVLSQRLEGHDGIVGLAKLRLREAADKPANRIFGAPGEVGVDAVERLLRLPGFEHTVDFLQLRIGGWLRVCDRHQAMQGKRDPDRNGVMSATVQVANTVQEHETVFPRVNFEFYYGHPKQRLCLGARRAWCLSAGTGLGACCAELVHQGRLHRVLRCQISRFINIRPFCGRCRRSMRGRSKYGAVAAAGRHAGTSLPRRFRGRWAAAPRPQIRP